MSLGLKRWRSRRTASIAGVVGTLVLTAGAGAGAFAQAPVAGTQPDRRPDGAPRVATADRAPQWIEWASRGVTPPNPPSLKWLSDQGNWFTPFSHRGMTGPYDIRGLHPPAPSTPPAAGSK